MNLIWHIARRDLARIRSSLIAFAVVSVLCAAVLSRIIDPEASRPDLLMVLNGGLLFVTTFLGYHTYVELSLSDPLCDSTAFWVTRPIAGARLLAAKIVGGLVIALVGAVSATIGVAIMDPASLRYPMSIAVVAAISFGLAGAMAFVVASISRSSRQCLIISAACVAAFFVVVEMLETARRSAVIPMDLQYARTGLTLALCAAVAVFVILNQFLARRRVRSIVFALLGLGAMILVSVSWPYSWPQPSLQAEENAADFHDVQLTLRYASASDNNRPRVRLGYAVTNAPPGFVASLLPSKHEWALGDAASPIRCWLEGARYSLQRQGTQDVEPLFSSSSANKSMEASGFAPAGLLDRDTKAYRGVVPLALWSMGVTAEFPMQAGPYLKTGSHRVLIAKSRRDSSVLDVTIDGPRETDEVYTQYAVINRRLDRRAPEASWSRNSASLSSAQRQRLTFRIKDSDADFWRDATLVEVTFKRVAVIHRTVETTDLRLNERK